MQQFPEWKKSNQYLYLLFIILVGTLSSWSSLLDPVLTTNDAGLAEVDIKVKIQSCLVECNVTLIYAGQANENVSSSRDTLFIEGVVDNLTITDSGGEDLFYVTEVHGNITVITYQFSHKLVPGEMYSVSCRYYQNSTWIAKYLYEYAIDIDWTGSAGIERVMMLFAPGLNLQMASNPPHFTSAKPLGLELRWFETSKEDFSSVFTYSRDPLSTLEITPEQWDADDVTLEDLPAFEISFYNDGEDVVTVQLETENWFTVNVTSLVIPVGHHKFVRCQIIATKAGVYSGTLKIHTNLSENYIFTVTITTTIESSGSDGIDWFPVVILALFIVIAGPALYVIKWKKYFVHTNSVDGLSPHVGQTGEKEMAPPDPIVTEEEIPPPIAGEIPESSSESILISRVNAMEGLLNKKEFKVLQVLLENNGINQQEIAELTGISKATVSRIVVKLSSNGLVEKRQSGMSNLIYLGKKITG